MAARPIPHSMTATALSIEGYRATQTPFDLMLKHAQELGASAVVGIQYDATEVIQGATEVLCYGTAIVAVRV